MDAFSFFTFNADGSSYSVLPNRQVLYIHQLELFFKGIFFENFWSPFFTFGFIPQLSEPSKYPPLGLDGTGKKPLMDKDI